MFQLRPMPFKSLALSVAMLITGSVLAQTRFNYQGVVRDANDTIVADEPVSLQFTIRQDSQTGLPVFQESHTGLTTSSIGLVTALIGGGTPGFGSLDSIPWSDHIYYLQVEVDVLSSLLGFLEMGVSPIVSVPLAQYASIAGNAGNTYWQPNSDGIHFDQGYVGINTTTPETTLDVNGVMRVTSNTDSKIVLMASGPLNSNRILVKDENDAANWYVELMDQDNDDRIGFGSALGNGTILSINHDGTTKALCLEILGGCDINERFNSSQMLEPGTVVIADPDRPGEVRMTDRAYDTRVIGTVSGANGINPGLTLTQEGTALDGTHPVALDGRVYVKVTGPVEVGDLLTTSTEPGKAMAVKNRKKAFGAVIGKALESDADGDGLVLMLVQPR